MSLAAVQYRCPGATSLPYDGPYYHRCFEAVREALDAITPALEAQPLETFYLDLTGLRQFQGAEPGAVAAAIRQVLPPRYSARVGLGTGRFTAWVAAHHGTPTRTLAVGRAEAELFLREAPATLLPAAPETRRRMELLGLKTLGQLQRLPRSAVLAQFGREGLYLHRLACGEDREPLDLATTPPVVRESLTFSAPATLPSFLVALRRLLRRLFARPERGQRGVRQVRLQAAFEEGGSWERTVTLRRPLEQPEPAYDELRRRLESVLPTAAVTELSVELGACAARLDCQPRLLDMESEWRAERLGHELEQLRTRRPETAVSQIVEVEPWSRLPEQQYALLSYDP
jgi:nucleotidyltransferase/DNA polymerase involved in DNA repair